MKLFIVAALIAAVSAARLDHLERSYLPPAQNNYAANSGGSSFPSAGGHGNFGFNQGSQYNAPGRGSSGFGSLATGAGSNGFGTGSHGSNGFGSSGLGSNGFGASGHGSNGFGASGHGSNGFGANSQGSNGFGGNNGAFGRNGGASAATSNQYLPPNYGSNGGSSPQSSIGSSIRPACSTCDFGSLPRYQTSSFDSQPSGQQYETGASRQYLAPKTSSQNSPQQPFDENTGYIY